MMTDGTVENLVSKIVASRSVEDGTEDITVADSLAESIVPQHFDRSPSLFIA